MANIRRRQKADQLGFDFQEADDALAEEGDEQVDYAVDPVDQLRAAIVKAHSVDKHVVLRKYVDACSAVRRRWSDEWGGQCCYIDLYSGPGRVRIGTTGPFGDGSPLAAWEASRTVKAGRHTAFAQCFIGDIDALNVEAVTKRLRERGATVTPFTGEAKDTSGKVAAALPSKGFHLAFLDPYNLRHMPFVVIQTLAKVSALDILLHFSVMDLRRNLPRALAGEVTYLDEVAPEWRSRVENVSKANQFAAFEAHWKSLVEGLGKPARGVELVRGTRGAHLYWLVLLSRSALAEKFFSDISSLGRQRRLWS